MGGSLGMNVRQPRKSISESNFRSPDVNAHFRQMDDGTTLFYPQGILGRRGFVVASAEQETLLRVSARGSRKVAAAVLLLNYLGGIVIAVFLAPSSRVAVWLYAGYVLALLSGMWLFLRFYSRRLTEGMELANVRNSPVAYWRSEGCMLTTLQLVFRLVFVAGTAGISAALALYLKRPDLFVLSGLMAMWCLPLLFMVQGWRRGNT